MTQQNVDDTMDFEVELIFQPSELKWLRSIGRILCAPPPHLMV
jgi:hypothetical protein